jgi:glycine/D-amino acid oxidase-like deaminating enzyme
MMDMAAEMKPRPCGLHRLPNRPAALVSPGGLDVGDPVRGLIPDIVLRAASRLHPKLAGYVGRLPRGAHHYGGYYTLTDENWPLIGPMATPGAFVAGALSGFGSMAACATGEICAAWITGNPVPDYAHTLSAARYDDPALMARIAAEKKGHL